jgi:peptidoglycan/xylan/chitin deacetylase (PgdA/CDA1 family)
MITDFMVGPFILMYHSIDDNSDDPFTVSVEAFREQISWLSEGGFEVVSLSFLLRSIQSGNNRALRKKVVITFDDGHKDFVTNALPILRDCGATATIFLVTDMLGGNSPWNEFGSHVPLMSVDEVRYIKAHGISLGSHTATHAKLTLLDKDELQRQLKDSHDRLTYLGESFYSLAYPWGQWSSQVADAVKASGYECALAVGEQTRLTAANTYALPRITMVRDMEIKSFQSLLTRTCIEIELRRRFWAVRETMFGTSEKSINKWNGREIKSDYAFRSSK